MRLIDADEFIKSINERTKEAIKWYDECRTDEIKIRAEQAMVTFCEAYLTAKKMPTIDAEPVVHCKDCKHWTKTIGWNCKEYTEFTSCLLLDRDTNEDFYCAYGEKMNEVNE